MTDKQADKWLDTERIETLIAGGIVFAFVIVVLLMAWAAGLIP